MGTKNTGTKEHSQVQEARSQVTTTYRHFKLSHKAGPGVNVVKYNHNI